MDEIDTSRRVVVRVSMDFLKDLLGLPENAVIGEVWTPENEKYRVVPRDFEMIVISPEFEQVKIGEDVPIACPSWKREYQSIAKFVEWGIKE